jgi:hypothetical protein
LCRSFPPSVGRRSLPPPLLCRTWPPAGGPP